MQLTESGLREEAWKVAGYALLEFDREQVRKATKENPFWLHLGAGNLFRAFQANVVQKLLNEGVLDRGLVIAEGYDYEIIDIMNVPHDNLSLLVTLKSDGSVDKTVVGSVMEALVLDSENENAFARLKEIFRAPSLQLVSFTITEKGYNVTDGSGQLYDTVSTDYKNGPDKPVSYIGKLTALMYERFVNGALPLALVSMDNCSHNGGRLQEAVTSFAVAWEENGLVRNGFLDYLNNPSRVTFPWSMIDKITPRPDDSIRKLLEKDGITDLELVITSKNTYIAPFVNAEECQYLIIEDAFPNGRPALEKGGILFTDRETVEKVERMKVCTCLNPLHTALAIFGCLLGYEKIHQEMTDPYLKKMIEIIGYKEGLPVVTNPSILDPKQFLNEVVTIRFPNPFMTDTPQRIATDTSQKLAIRFGETIKAYLADEALNVKDLKLIPLVFAGWCRYLLGIDDNGKEFTISPDPLLSKIRPYLSTVHLGEDFDAETVLKPVFINRVIFGVDLYTAGLAPLVIQYFTELTQGVGSVRKTLEKHIGLDK
jgi:fructuronate reductase